MPALHSQKTQRGVALLVALVFLVVLTILGLATMRGTTLQERMAGGSRDYNIALQAAEAALRDAEADVKTRAASFFSFPVLLWANATVAARSGCNTGAPLALCVVDNPTVQLYLPSAGVIDWTGATSVGYGSSTGAAPIPGVAQQPRYFFELLRWPPTPALNNPQDGGTQAGVTYVYVRITARAWGASAQTQVYLQEVYLLPVTGT